MDHYTELHLAKSALVTIDTQNDFVLDGAPAQISGTSAILPRMVELLDRYRQLGRPIIHVIRLYSPDGSDADLCRRQKIEEGASIAAPGTHGAQLCAEILPARMEPLDWEGLHIQRVQEIAPNEFVIYKPRWGAFYDTLLEDFLRFRGIDSLVICGCNFPNCPRATIYEASERDFRVGLVEDAVSRATTQSIEEMRRMGVEVVSTRALLARLTAEPVTLQTA